jgi:two-component system, cell cycle response regulator
MPDKLALLIVEDNAAERTLVDALLADYPSVERRMADSLSAAQRAIDERAPDVVLLDLELPDARGLDGVGWLLRRNPGLPIVVVSGFGADDLLVASEAVGLGAQDFLGKNRLDGPELVRALHFARARKRREVAALAAALRDPLTGLPRPALLEERVLRGLARSHRQRASLAMLHLDIDGFAAFADAAGSERAEQRLVEIARRLQGELRRTDILARLDGTAFLVVVDGMKHASDAYVVARKLLAAVRRPFADDLDEDDGSRGHSRHLDQLNQSPLRLSIGVAQWCREIALDEPGQGGSGAFAAHCARAESAMYEARRQGGDRYAAAAELALAAE